MVEELLISAGKILEAAQMKKSSLKSLIYESKCMDKGRLTAVTMETQRYLPIIKKLLEASGVHGNEEISESLFQVITYDLLFGKGLKGRNAGRFRIAIRPYQPKIKDALRKLKEETGAMNGRELLGKFGRKAKEDPMPRWVRVNLLKNSYKEVEEALITDGFTCIVRRDEVDGLLEGKDPESISSMMGDYLDSLKIGQFIADLHLPDVLVFASGTHLFTHILYQERKIILMDKASCISAFVLAPPADSHVIDACAAPGNKTNHLSCLMQNTGKIFAFDMDKNRMTVLSKMIDNSGCTNVEAQCEDFLKIEPDDPTYAKVTHILVDPSCSGTGIVSRKDHLMGEGPGQTRLKLLRGLQLRILNHAMKFPKLKKVVYSTCSVKREENEDVVWRILHAHPDFELELVLPSWSHRPLPGKCFDKRDETFENDGYERDESYYKLRQELEEEISKKCIRASFEVDKTNGFFVALFRRTGSSERTVEMGEAGERMAPPWLIARDGPKEEREEKRQKTGHDVIASEAVERHEIDIESLSPKKRKMSGAADDWATSVGEIKRKKAKKKKLKDEGITGEGDEQMKSLNTTEEENMGASRKKKKKKAKELLPEITGKYEDRVVSIIEGNMEMRSVDRENTGGGGSGDVTRKKKKKKSKALLDEIIVKDEDRSISKAKQNRNMDNVEMDDTSGERSGDVIRKKKKKSKELLEENTSNDGDRAISKAKENRNMDNVEMDDTSGEKSGDVLRKKKKKKSKQLLDENIVKDEDRSISNGGERPGDVIRKKKKKKAKY